MVLEAAELQNADPIFDTWSIMEDEELVDGAELDISEAEERGGTIPQKQTGGTSERNNTRQYDSLEADRSSVEFRVEMSSKCREEYAKICKRGNPELLEQIANILEKLKTNPELGKRLTWDQGERSIRIARFRFRVLYKIKKPPSPAVVILSIGPRGSVYDEQERYNSSQKSTPP